MEMQESDKRTETEKLHESAGSSQTWTSSDPSAKDKVTTRDQVEPEEKMPAEREKARPRTKLERTAPRC